MVCVRASGVVESYLDIHPHVYNLLHHNIVKSMTLQSASESILVNVHKVDSRSSLLVGAHTIRAGRGGGKENKGLKGVAYHFADVFYKFLVGEYFRAGNCYG